ncbi:MAG: response regulator [Thermodesulfovibrionales bacterium]
MAHKLLLADDSITIQKVIELILAEEEFEIKSANNGEEALALIPSYRPDIILADIEMPKMNGYQLCEKIKQDPSTSNIPVILLTGAFEPLDEELAKHVKADDFIIKPFESQDLISKINAALTISAVAEAESDEGILEAEAIGIEEMPAEEDLWAMEEITESKEFAGLPAEEGIAAGTEELIEIAEEAEAAIFEEPAPSFAEKARVADIRPAMPETELPSKNEMKAIFEKTVQERMSSLVSSLDMKETVLAALTPLIKDSVEKILWEVTPDLVERMLKEMLKGSLESLTKEVEKVIWETVPDLAETMISKEIERIRSEF